jgi:hypothetical protein
MRWIVELRQLEHFLAVVEAGSFTAAAARPYMVQSSLSASLLSLERERAQCRGPADGQDRGLVEVWIACEAPDI